MKTFFKKFVQLVPATLILLAAVAASVSMSLTQFVSKAQEAPTYDFNFEANKTQVNPGEDFQYTITVENKGEQNVDNIRAYVILSDKISYVPGSSVAEKGSNTAAFDDNWIADTANLGTLTSHQKVFLRFTVKANADTASGDDINTFLQVKAGEETEWKQKNTHVQIINPDVRAQFEGGNFVKVANVTQGGSGWQDEEVSGDLGNIIEFLVYIKNTSNTTAHNVKIKANLPGQSQQSKHLKPSVTITSDNADSVTDDVQVYTASTAFMDIHTGHAKIGGSTDLFNCPDMCDFPESFYHTPVNMGTIDPGETIQIKFKTNLLQMATPTPTPTPTPSPTPEPKKDRSCFEARVWEDLNGNGRFDEGEPGLTWELDWRRDGDQLWTEYKTYADKNRGMGGVVCQDDEPNITTKLRVKDWCIPTTSTEQQGKLEFNKTKYFEFGCTRKKQTYTKTETPKQLPKTGNAGQYLVGSAMGLFSVGTGMTLLRRRLNV